MSASWRARSCLIDRVGGARGEEGWGRGGAMVGWMGGCGRGGARVRMDGGWGRRHGNRKVVESVVLLRVSSGCVDLVPYVKCG